MSARIRQVAPHEEWLREKDPFSSQLCNYLASRMHAWVASERTLAMNLSTISLTVFSCEFRRNLQSSACKKLKEGFSRGSRRDE